MLMHLRQELSPRSQNGLAPKGSSLSKRTPWRTLWIFSKDLRVICVSCLCRVNFISTHKL